MKRHSHIVLALSLLSVSALAQQTTSGFDTTNGTDLIFGVNGAQVGDWNTSQLAMTTGLSAVQVVSTQTGSGNFRMLSQAAPNGFGAFFYNDSNGTYLLLTNNNDSLGNANNLRPFSVNDTTGTVTIDDGGYGKVGVNTDTPQTELDVNGGIRSGYDGNNCSGNNEGTQRYNTSIHNYEYCNGSSWQPLGSSSAVSGTWCGAQGAIEGGNYPWQGYYPLSNGCPPGWSQRIFNVYGGGGLGFCIKN